MACLVYQTTHFCRLSLFNPTRSLDRNRRNSRMLWFLSNSCQRFFRHLASIRVSTQPTMPWARMSQRARNKHYQELRSNDRFGFRRTPPIRRTPIEGGPTAQRKAPQGALTSNVGRFLQPTFCGFRHFVAKTFCGFRQKPDLGRKYLEEYGNKK